MSLILSGDTPKITADSTGVITSGTAVAASGTSVDFTGIPDNVVAICNAAWTPEVIATYQEQVAKVGA